MGEDVRFNEISEPWQLEKSNLQYQKKDNQEKEAVWEKDEMHFNIVKLKTSHPS